MSKLNDIKEGWKNSLMPPKDKKEFIENVQRERLEICHRCPHHSMFHKTLRPDDHCTKCGCTLKAKTACLHCSCPLENPKWGPIIPKE